LGQGETDSVVVRDNTSVFACSYKIKATSGAPGFNLYTDAPPGVVIASWVEYDLNNINIVEAGHFENFGDWPGYNQHITDMFCGDACTQGQLLPRLAIDNDDDSELSRVSAYDMLHDLAMKRQEIASYQNNFNLISSFNAEYDQNIALPEAPEAYDGHTFQSTAHNGGYG
jgi:hypothetical protein